MTSKNSHSWLFLQRSYVIEFLRVYLGLGLCMKGFLLMWDTNQANQFMLFTHFPAWSFFFIHYAILAQLVGGLFLALGLITRVAAIVQIPVMFGAIFYEYLQRGFFSHEQTLEFALLVLVLLLVFAVYGSGRLSLDHVLNKIRKN